ncbi:FKBP-type peptidyl-prolyl cis-trans isomerase [Spongiibacter taiwanensis]|uniref:FKBP-type peptidyl-prolyl cis-trans isomerase n=1 Tax=Spongiibacter taiwanensis TaxID=1748242 RepID=UPI0020362CAD|nr:FKBP-type peptidyl-prolyl cis-trans isomerase [Spongiibacter taiwanensis]USA44777.1 FKBP-type peptidyl-prolyl cis-trans isomerase [Spongiibacter taiwanensis]
MKKSLFCVAMATGLLVGCTGGEDSEPKLDSEIAKVSYGIGVNIGSRFGDDLPLDVDAFSAGVSDALAGGDLKMTDEEIMSTLQSYQQKQMAARQAEAKALGDKNQAEAEAFFAENAEKEGVVTTDSGLQYMVLAEGEGDKPGEEDMVEVHYRGTLLDGSVFDSSYDRGQTVSFPVNGVIPGWTEALQLMSEGAKYKLFIPSELAYGAGGAGEMIGPNAALVFEVELIDVVDEEAEEGAAK